MKSSSGTPNQDSFSFTLLESGWMVCIACDGHGEAGEVVSQRATRMLPLFYSLALQNESPDKALRTAFLEAQSDLERCFGKAQENSGATVAACIFHHENQEAWVAHAGDSRVVVGDIATGLPVFQTDEHKAHDPGEAERLKECGAQVIVKKYEDGELVSRVFVPKTGAPGLAMSRSLGDGCLKKYGVTADPEIQDISGLWKSCEAPILVLASDGLWDTISVEETVTALTARSRSGLDVQLGAEALLRRSQRLWIEAESDYCDDVTVLLMAPHQSLVSRKPR
jgi:serine/threonine protein phosphatase PrpC